MSEPTDFDLLTIARQRAFEGCEDRLVEALDRAIARLPPRSAGPTKRVRIAVAVGPRGIWTAAGWSTLRGVPAIDADLECDVREATDDAPLRVSWVEADVPLPIAEVIEGEVK